MSYEYKPINIQIHWSNIRSNVDNIFFSQEVFN